MAIVYFKNEVINTKEGITENL